jgi:hypothetical protein
MHAGRVPAGEVDGEAGLAQIHCEQRAVGADPGSDERVGAQAGTGAPGFGAAQPPTMGPVLSGEDRFWWLGRPDAPPLSGFDPFAPELGEDRVRICVCLEEAAHDDILPSGGREGAPSHSGLAGPRERERSLKVDAHRGRKVGHVVLVPGAARAEPSSPGRHTSVDVLELA